VVAGELERALELAAELESVLGIKAEGRATGATGTVLESCVRAARETGEEAGACAGLGLGSLSEEGSDEERPSVPVDEWVTCGLGVPRAAGVARAEPWEERMGEARALAIRLDRSALSSGRGGEARSGEESGLSTRGPANCESGPSFPRAAAAAAAAAAVAAARASGGERARGRSGWPGPAVEEEEEVVVAKEVAMEVLARKSGGINSRRKRSRRSSALSGLSKLSTPPPALPREACESGRSRTAYGLGECRLLCGGSVRHASTP
jgi:hypothetical protein